MISALHFRFSARLSCWGSDQCLVDLLSSYQDGRSALPNFCNADFNLPERWGGANQTMLQKRLQGVPWHPLWNEHIFPALHAVNSLERTRVLSASSVVRVPRRARGTPLRLSPPWWPILVVALVAWSCGGQRKLNEFINLCRTARDPVTCARPVCKKRHKPPYLGRV